MCVGVGGLDRNIVRYFDTLSSNRWVFCISDLIDEIYHYIEIRSMISWIVIMLLLILPKDIPTRPEGQNIVFCTPPQPH